MFDSLKLYTNENIDTSEINARLVQLGYSAVENVSEEGDFCHKGEVLIIYPASFEYPVRIELSYEKILSIKSVDLGTFKTIDEHKGVIILPADILRKRSFKKELLMEGIEQPIQSFVDIEPGDYVVHLDYGIGKYIGMRKLPQKKGKGLHFVLEYKAGDKLYVEDSQLHKIQRYISFHRRAPKINRLRGSSWQRTKKLATSGAKEYAQDLIRLQASRKKMKGFAFSSDTEWQKDLEKTFPYKETPDQLKASMQVKSDMERALPMDRLLCGDVGYGKTEVALRAAFKAVMDNKQVAFLVPTTILAEQHTATFGKRLGSFPVNVQMLNRFRTPKEQNNVLQGLRSGKVDIVVGTHRLLSSDVDFKDLGLLIVDEEQRFGVKHKEKLKKMRANVDILTLTATPIPRTLYLALSGGKDISVIETPPLDRMPVSTEILERNDKIIRDAVEKELQREGQVFFVHNRVRSIDKVAENLRKLVPGARVRIAHGQMNGSCLEKTMLDFIKGQIDVLVCTTIIESGIDIPNANTMIMDNAHQFGLSDMYQLRGRIGRFDRKAYAYLLVRNFRTLTSPVKKRLEAIKRFQDLGSGFKLAMRDLEMRGAGNILGVQQSGFIDQVGFDLYCRLLKVEIQKLSEKEALTEA